MNKQDNSMGRKWWAVEVSNLRPLPCQGLSTNQVIDLYKRVISELYLIYSKVRKFAQFIMRMLRKPSQDEYLAAMNMAIEIINDQERTIQFLATRLALYEMTQQDITKLTNLDKTIH